MAKHFDSNFKLDMLDKELAVKVNICSWVANFIWFTVALTLNNMYVSVKGWNWGVANFNGGVIHFEVNTEYVVIVLNLVL